MINKVEQIRLQFKPNRVRMLFVGESAPAGGTFFYYGNSNLYRYTNEAFTNAFGEVFINPHAFFKFFMEKGCYLDDLCLSPVNFLDKSERRRERETSERSLSQRIREYKPDIIITVMKAIDTNVKSAVIQSGIKNTLYFSLPFPNQGNQRKYVNELDQILTGI